MLFRSLRQRRDDIPILIQDFLRHHPVAVRKKITRILPKAVDHLMRYGWPGNIRELHNVLEQAVILTKSRVLNVADLNVDLVNLTTESETSKTNVSKELSLIQWIREQEKEYLIDKLKTFRGRIDLTARSSGVDVRTLHRKMRLYGLDKKVFSTKAVLKKL